jgi:macrolide transport system ATP-binding/permease protein
MFWLRLIYTRLYGLLRKDRIEQEMDDEMRFHLLMRTRENIERGMRPDEAEREARRRFGNVGRIKDLARDIKGGGFMETLLQDLRYGARMLLKAPGFTAVAALTLALGIGVNTAIFTLFDIFLRPLPVKDPDTVVTLDRGTSERRWFSYPDYAYFRDNAQSFSGLVARGPEQILLNGRDASEDTRRVNAEFVSDNFFSTLGVGAVLGRTFTPEDNSAAGKQPVVVLSHHFWQSHFTGAPKVIGQTLRFQGKPFTVIGVMARGFAGIGPETCDLWLPLLMKPEVGSQWGGNSDLFGSRNIQWLMLTGRLKSGRTMGEARAEMKLISGQLASAYPQLDPNKSDQEKIVRLTPAARLPADTRGFWPMMGVVLGATGLVLLIACSNIANLLLARTAVRGKEVGVRLCLGASRGRVIRQLMTESLLLAGIGGGAGLLLAWWSAGLMVSAVLSRVGDDKVVAAALNLAPDARILAFTLLLSLLSAVAFGLAPALRTTRLDLVATIKDEGAALGHLIGRSRLRNGLVIAQVAICLTLLMTAGLLLRGLIRAVTMDPGFETKNVLFLGLNLGDSGYTKARAEQFKRDLSARLAVMPGVQSVSPGVSPMWDGNYTTISAPANDGSEGARYRGVPYLQASHNYFETVGLRIVRGRGFTEEETRARAAVAVVSESTARNLWPGADPLGKELRMESKAKSSQPGAVELSTVQVIGVARDVHSIRRIGEIPPLKFFTPATEGLSDPGLVRTTGDARKIKPLVMAAIRELDPSLIADLETLEEAIVKSNRVRATDVVSLLATVLGLLAFFLATIGIYGVMSYAAGQRTREIGIRMALGARGRDVMKLVVRQGMSLVLIGVAIGLAASLAVGQLLKSFLFGLSAADPMTFGIIPLLLAAVALLACYLPARRSAKVDPMVALRCE